MAANAIRAPGGLGMRGFFAGAGVPDVRLKDFITITQRDVNFTLRLGFILCPHHKHRRQYGDHHQHPF
jgi:hypothetical protein